MAYQNMVGIAQLAEHRIVVPGVVGSSPITHPIPWLRAGASAPALASFLTLGCSQVVRHGTLTPAFVGSSPTIPATSVQAAYRASCRKRQALLTSLHLLSPPNPLRWASAGSPRIAVASSANRCGVTSPRREPKQTTSYDPLAQLVEQRPFKAKVRGSSPRRVTKKQHWIHPVLFFDYS